jgi:hypothetical protein
VFVIIKTQPSLRRKSSSQHALNSASKAVAFPMF